MQTSDRILAGRYGRALYLAAEGAGAAERVHADILETQRALIDAQGFLHNPRTPVAQKKKKIEELLGGKAHAVTLKFLGFLIDKKRFALLPLMAAQLSRLIAEKKNVARASVRTARPLGPEAQERLKKGLTAFSGKSVELDVREDAELLGGVVVRLGDWVLDSSLRGQLRRMRESINGA